MGVPMAHKQDATQKLPADEPTQKSPKGLKIGVPREGTFKGMLKKIARKDQPG